MFGRIIWFGTGAVSGALGALWTERKVRKALRRQRRAAAERVIAPPDSTRAAILRRGARAQNQLRAFYGRRRRADDSDRVRTGADGEASARP